MDYFRGPFFKIRVINLDTGAVYVHYKVPDSHVGMIELNPNLKVERLSPIESGDSNDKETYTDIIIDDI